MTLLHYPVQRYAAAQYMFRNKINDFTYETVINKISLTEN